jgi:hypothetical protein
MVAVIFAIASSAAAGAGAGAGAAWTATPYAAEINDLKARTDFADYVDRRVVAMTAPRRRQFDALMQLPRARWLS